MENISDILRRQVSLVAIEITDSNSYAYTHTLKALNDSLEICPRLVHIRLMANGNLFPVFEPAVRVLIESRPHIRVSIALQTWRRPGRVLDMRAYTALSDLYPKNVEIVSGIMDDFLTPLFAEHDN
jgi:hypothetical protein